MLLFFFFSSRRRHTRLQGDWSSDVCSSDLGIDDFALAKRKAARQLGASERQSLPRNDEIEAELRAYRALYQADEHPELVEELRRIALDAMQALQHFSPYRSEERRVGKECRSRW